MRSYMSTLVLPVRTVLDIAVEGFLCLCSSHWCEVGGAQLGKRDVIYYHAPISIKKHLNPNLMTAVGSFARPPLIKSDKKLPHGPDGADQLSVGLSNE